MAHIIDISKLRRASLLLLLKYVLLSVIEGFKPQNVSHQINIIKVPFYGLFTFCGLIIASLSCFIFIIIV